jgi:predicted phage-related endonuclease
MTAKPAYQSPEWYAERQTYIGASEMAEAVGLSRWGDPISLWEKKIGEAPERDSTFRMMLGSLTEPIIGKLASEALGVKLRRVTGPVRHPEHPFLASNPDFRIVGARGLVQAKFRLAGEHFGDDDESGSGESIPLHYRVQGFGELLTTGLDFVYFAVLDPFAGLSLHLLDRRTGENEQVIEDLRLDLVEFWQEYVEPRRMPPPTAESSEALARRFPKRAGQKIGRVASAEQEQMIRDVVAARDARDEAERAFEAAKNRAKAAIGEAAWIEGDGVRLSWGETTRKTVAWKEVAAVYRRIATDAMAEIRRLDPVIQHPAGTGFDPGDLDTIEGLYTTESTGRGPFTISELKQ